PMTGLYPEKQSPGLRIPDRRSFPQQIRQKDQAFRTSDVKCAPDQIRHGPSIPKARRKPLHSPSPVIGGASAYIKIRSKYIPEYPFLCIVCRTLCRHTNGSAGADSERCLTRLYNTTAQIRQTPV